MRILLANLELRLDLALYRSNFIYSPKLTTFLIESGHVKVNGVKSTRRNYKLKINDKVNVTFPVSLYGQALRHYKEILSKRLIFNPCPRYIEVSYKNLEFVIFKKPIESEAFYPFDYAISYFYRLYPK
jgi:ribosomal protein S4